MLTEIFKRAFVAIEEMLVRVMCSRFDGNVLYDLSVPAKDEVRLNRIRRALYVYIGKLQVEHSAKIERINAISQVLAVNFF